MDTVLWLALQHRQTAVNRWTTRLVLPAVLLAECWVNYACAVRLARWGRHRGFECALGLFSVVLFVQWWRTCRTTVEGDAGYLRWCDEATDDDERLSFETVAGRVAFLVFLILPVIVAFPRGRLRGIVIATTLLTFVYALPRPDFGARWCWTANAISLLAVAALATC